MKHHSVKFINISLRFITESIWISMETYSISWSSHIYLRLKFFFSIYAFFKFHFSRCGTRLIPDPNDAGSLGRHPEDRSLSRRYRFGVPRRRRHSPTVVRSRIPTTPTNIPSMAHLEDAKQQAVWPPHDSLSHLATHTPKQAIQVRCP